MFRLHLAHGERISHIYWYDAPLNCWRALCNDAHPAQLPNHSEPNGRRGDSFCGECLIRWDLAIHRLLRPKQLWD